MNRKTFQMLFLMIGLALLMLATPTSITQAQETTPTPEPTGTPESLPFDPEGSNVEIVATGEGWQHLRLEDLDGTLAERGVPIDPESQINEVMVINGVNGLENVDLPGTMAQDMASAMQADGGVNDVIIVNLEMLDALEEGNQERIEQLHENFDMVDEEGDTSNQRGCSRGWYDKTKSHTVNLQNINSSSPVNIGGINLGNLNVNMPMQGQVTGELHYQIWKEKIWFVCITTAVRYVGFRTHGSMYLQQGLVDLETTVLNRDFHWRKQVMNPKIGEIFFMAGPVPIWIKFYLPVNIGVLGNATLQAHLGIQSHGNGYFTFDMMCKPGQGCQGTRVGSFTFTNPFPEPVGALELRLKAMAYAEPGIKASLYFQGFLDTYLNFRVGVVGDLWGYIGNACGDGNGDGQSEMVYAAMLDVEVMVNTSVGMHFFGMNIFDTQLPLGFLEGAGWRPVHFVGEDYYSKFLTNVDLIPTGSTAMTPMFIRQIPTIDSQYVLKMRPCVPYTDQVNYQVNWGDGQVQNLANAPQNSNVVNHTWNSFGTFNLQATAVSDSLGRQFTNAHTTQQITRIPVWNELPPVVTLPAMSNMTMFSEATASSVHCVAGPMGNPRCYHPDSVNNGVVANNDMRPAFSWASAGNQALPQWVQLQWPYTIETNHVDVHTMQNYKVQDFTVEYWDGSNWQVAASVQGNQDVSRGVDFPAVQTNAIRIVGTKGSIGEPNIIRINEITVQGRRLDVAWVTYIRPLNSQKCLDISGVSLAAGADAHQWDCHGGQNQQFAFYPVVGQPGTYNVIAVHSGKCLEVTSGSYADGAIVQQADCNGGNNQKFRLTSVPALGSLQDFQITVAHSNKCLDVTNNQTTNGTLIQQFSCHSLIGTPTTFNQIWHLQNKP